VDAEAHQNDKLEIKDEGFSDSITLWSDNFLLRVQVLHLKNILDQMP